MPPRLARASISDNSRRGLLKAIEASSSPNLGGSSAHNARLVRRSFTALEHLGQRPSCSSLTTEPLFVIRVGLGIASCIVSPYRTNGRTIHIPKGISNCAVVRASYLYKFSRPAQDAACLAKNPLSHAALQKRVQRVDTKRPRRSGVVAEPNQKRQTPGERSLARRLP